MGPHRRFMGAEGCLGLRADRTSTGDRVDERGRRKPTDVLDQADRKPDARTRTDLAVDRHPAHERALVRRLPASGDAGDTVRPTDGSARTAVGTVPEDPGAGSCG